MASESQPLNATKGVPTVLLYRALGSSLPTLLGPIARLDATHELAVLQARLRERSYDFVVCEVQSAAAAKPLLELLAIAPEQSRVVLYSYVAPDQLPAVGDGGQVLVLHGASVTSQLLRLIQAGSNPPDRGSGERPSFRD